MRYLLLLVSMILCVNFTTLSAQGNALNLDGVNDYINVPNASAYNFSKFTFETWLLWNPTNANDLQFLSSKGFEIMELHTSSIGVNSLRFIPTTGVFLDATNVLTPGRWQHIACVYDPSISLAKMYINGVEVVLTNNGANPLSTAITNNNNAINLGRRADASFYLKGSLDEVRIFNTVRSSSEVYADMISSIPPSTPNLITYYNFNTGAASGNNVGATSVTDLSTNANNAVIINAALTGNTSNWVESYAMVVPTATAATNVSGTSFTANWVASALGTVDNYFLYVSTTADFASFVSGYNGLSVSGTSQIVTGLQTNTIYFYRVRANKNTLNGVGSNSNTIAVANVSAPGSALDLDGTNDFVNIPHNTALNVSKFTIETWIKWSPNAGRDIGFLAGKGFEVMEIHTGGANANNLRFIPVPGVFLDVDNGLTPGRWQHIACVYDPSQALVKIYINGIERAFVNNSTAPLTTTVPTNTNPFQIGKRSGEFAYYFKGAIDEYRIFNDVRTQAQIQAGMVNSIPANTPGLVGYYNLDDALGGLSNTTATTASDLSPTVNNATLQNFSLSSNASNWVESYAMVIPTATAATNAFGSGFTANWVAPTIGVINEYKLDIATDSNFTNIVAAYNAFVVTGTSQLITGLNANTTYYYRVRANKSTVQDQGGYSKIITVFTSLQAPGNAINLDGVDDYLTLPHISAYNVSKFTVQGWVLWNPNNNTDIQFLFGKGNEVMEIHTGVTANTLRFIPAPNVYLDVPNILTPGRWQHITCVYDPSQSLAKIYINGIDVAYTNNGTSPLSTPVVNNTTGINVGRRFNNLYFFKGSIDELRFFNDVRSLAQVQADMQNTIPANTSGLIASFSFDEGVANGNNAALSVITDASVTANNATAQNLALSGNVSNLVESYAMVIPTLAAATNIGTTDFIVNWQPSAIGLANSYFLDVSTSTNFSSFVLGYSSLEVNGTSQLINGLAANTTYYYRVRANKTTVTGTGTYSSVGTQTTNMQATRYVKQLASGNGDGSSWANASNNLQAIIDISSNGDAIWIAAGTYKPTKDETGNANPTDNRTKTFFIKSGIKIYGGFAGTETQLSQQNINTNITVLSGDFNGDDSYANGYPTANYNENAYHTVYFNNATSATILNGVTVKDAYFFSDGSTAAANYGAVYINASSPVIVNCKMVYNRGNYGAIALLNGSNPTFSNTVITNNLAVGGAGIYSNNSNSLVLNAVFNNNTVTNAGVAWIEGNASPDLVNAVFSNNTGSADGVAVFYNSTVNKTLLTCTFYNNTGGSVLHRNGTGICSVVNGIIWGNSGNAPTGTPTVTYSNVQGGFTGSGNINADPQFASTSNLIGPDNIWMTNDDGLMIGCLSPSRNNGLNSATPSVDIVGTLRPQFSVVDMGAYESIAGITASSISISSSSTRVCSTDEVTFTATPVNGGSTPTYQWRKNGNNVGLNSSTYTATGWVQGDVITCVLSSSNNCTTNSTSNAITINTGFTASVTIAASATQVCSTDNITFTATPTNGGGSPVYQWKKNNINVGGNSSTYTANNWAQGDIIICELTSAIACALPAVASSNQLTITVGFTPTISVTSTTNIVGCNTTTNATFTALTTNAGNSPSYQWKKNNVNVGTNSSTYTDNALNNGDIITCQLTSNAPCATINSVTSLPVTFNNGRSIIFVRANATGANNGSSWANAYTNLQTALTFATTCSAVQQIWVAAGIYSAWDQGFQEPAIAPQTQPDIRNKSFKLANGVAVYGGFVGTETALSQRNFSTNLTILKGTTGTTLNNTIASGPSLNKTYHVVSSANNASAYTRLDGFIIREGSADFVGNGIDYRGKGGGLLLYSTSGNTNNTVVENCTFLYNYADQWGGGALKIILSGNPVVRNCIFRFNSARFTAGLEVENLANPLTVENCVFANNSAFGSVGSWIQCANLTFDNCVFVENGGTLVQSDANSGSIFFRNSTFFKNTGGSSLVNTTRPITFINSILWQNNHTIHLGSFPSSSTTIQHSLIPTDITAFTNGGGNIYGSPQFKDEINLFGADNIWRTADDGLMIDANSPAAYTGITASMPTTDILGNSRFNSNSRGAYEPTSTWSGAVSSDWANASNWLGGIPSIKSNVYINSTVSNFPILNSGDGFSRNFSVPHNAQATIGATGNFKLAGQIINNGTINASNGSLVLVGTTVQTIPANLFSGNNLKNLVINNEAGVTLGGNINISGAINTLAGQLALGNNNITLVSSATNTASIAATTVVNPFTYGTGRFHVQRYIAGGNSDGTPGRRGFRFLSHPFTTDLSLTQLRATGNIDISGMGGAANGFDATTTNNASAFWYDPTALNAGNSTTVGSGVSNDAGWQAFTRGTGVAVGSNPNLWKKGNGIRVLFRGAKGEGLTYNGTNYTASDVTLSMNGTVNTGNQTFTLPGGANNQWSLVGNPYPSPIQVRTLLNNKYNGGAGNIGAVAYVFNPNKAGTSRGGYDAIDISSTGSFVLPAYGVVLVQNKQATANTINFAEVDKTTGSSLAFRTTTLNANISIHLLDSATEEILDDYDLRFDNHALVGTINDAKDGGKMLNNYAIYSISDGDNQMLKLDSRPEPRDATSIVRLGLNSITSKRFVIKVVNLQIPTGYSAFLRDKWLQVEQAITSGGYTYNFGTTTDTASQGNHRFELVFKQSATLPVTFTSVKAYQQASGINVEWNVGVEHHLASYDVEESANGINFTKAGSKIATGRNNYSWYDGSVNNGNNFYRIKAINTDGTVQYSNIVNVRIGQSEKRFVVAPTRITNGIVTVLFENADEGQYTLKVYNTAGQLVKQQVVSHAGGSTIQSLELNTLTAGTYQLQITNGQVSSTQRIVVQ